MAMTVAMAIISLWPWLINYGDGHGHGCVHFQLFHQAMVNYGDMGLTEGDIKPWLRRECAH